MLRGNYCPNFVRICFSILLLKTIVSPIFSFFKLNPNFHIDYHIVSDSVTFNFPFKILTDVWLTGIFEILIKCQGSIETSESIGVF